MVVWLHSCVDDPSDMPGARARVRDFSLKRIVFVANGTNHSDSWKCVRVGAYELRRSFPGATPLSSRCSLRH